MKLIIGAPRRVKTEYTGAPLVKNRKRYFVSISSSKRLSLISLTGCIWAVLQRCVWYRSDDKQEAISRVFGTQSEDISINCSCSVRGLVPHQLHFNRCSVNITEKWAHFHHRSPQAWRNKRGKLIFFLTPTIATCFLSVHDSILFWNPSGSCVTDMVVTQR